MVVNRHIVRCGHLSELAAMSNRLVDLSPKRPRGTAAAADLFAGDDGVAEQASR